MKCLRVKGGNLKDSQDVAFSHDKKFIAFQRDFGA